MNHHQNHRNLLSVFTNPKSQLTVGNTYKIASSDNGRTYNYVLFEYKGIDTDEGYLKFERGSGDTSQSIKVDQGNESNAKTNHYKVVGEPGVYVKIENY